MKDKVCIAAKDVTPAPVVAPVRAPAAEPSRAPAAPALAPHLLSGTPLIRRTVAVGGDRWGGQEAPAELLATLRSSSGGGAPLPDEMRENFGAGLGADLSAVRIHYDESADRMARSIDAAAFTAGSDIYFGRGQYRPHSSIGRRVLAHEVAHVVQRRPLDNVARIGRADDPAEADADRTADTLLAGGRLPADTSAASGPGGRALRRVVQYMNENWGTEYIRDAEALKLVLPEDLVEKLYMLEVKKYDAWRARFDQLLLPDRMFPFDDVSDIAYYIETGGTGYVTGPNQSPAHYEKPDPTTGTLYEMDWDAHPAATSYPQSPNPYTGADRDDIEIPDAAPKDALLDQLEQIRGSKAEKKTRNIMDRPSLNLFRAEVRLDFRLSQLTRADDGEGWQHGNAFNTEVSQQTDIYQSTSTKLATSDRMGVTSRETTSRADIEHGMRLGGANAATLAHGGNKGQFTTLSVANPNRKDRKDKEGNTLPPLDYRQLAATNPDGEYELTYNQVSSSCFHSEVQFLGQAEKEMPPVVDRLLRDAVAAAREYQGESDGVELVFTSLVLYGASVPNTVCGNACKPSLSLLLDYVNGYFGSTYRAAKPSWANDDIYVRSSAEYVATMSVSSTDEFVGYGKGAIDVVNKKLRPDHLVVREFKPRRMEADKPKSAPKKAGKGSSKSAAPKTTGRGSNKRKISQSGGPSKKKARHK